MRVPDCLANPRMQGKLQLFSDPQKQSTLPVPSLALASRGCAVARQALEIGSPIGSLGVNEIFLADLGVICRYMWIYLHIFIYFLFYLFTSLFICFLCTYYLWFMCVFIYSFMCSFVLFMLSIYLLIYSFCWFNRFIYWFIYFFPLPYAVHAERRDSSSCGCRLPDKLLTSTYNTGPDGSV